VGLTPPNRRRRLAGAIALALGAACIALPTADARAATGPALAVDGEAGRHPISPLIYGMNFAEPGIASEIALPVNRWGGDATDTYNFRIGADNVGADYYYENVADCWNEEHEWCSELHTNDVFAYREFVAADRALGARTLFNLPMVGYVANSAPVSQPLDCSFPATEFPDQEHFDEWDENCGNGVTKAGSDLPSHPSRAGTAVTTAYDGEFVEDLVKRFGGPAAGGVSIFELGNEPGLWDSTHRDFHPTPTTYDELWEKSRDAALEVKAHDPSAEILAFSEWGWPNYFCSAADGAPSEPCTAQSPDRAAHGGTPLVEWLLQQFHRYEEEHGTRLLNYLDVHYYAAGGANAEVTRSLWDPTYTDPSWIASRIDLIPRMHEWVAHNYPGTKISLSEYNLSVTENPVINALTQANALGIFGREGLDLATRWALPNDGPLIDDAFRMYRDYNGAHGTFGDTSVQATSTDSNRLAIYAAQRSSDGAYTVLVVNDSEEPLTSPLKLAGIEAAPAAEAWQWTGAAIEHLADQSVVTGGLTATYPAQSMTLYVVPVAGASPTRPPESSSTATGAQAAAALLPATQLGAPVVITKPGHKAGTRPRSAHCHRLPSAHRTRRSAARCPRAARHPAKRRHSGGRRSRQDN
jgi:hypothetical protein